MYFFFEAVGFVVEVGGVDGALVEGGLVEVDGGFLRWFLVEVFIEGVVLEGDVVLVENRGLLLLELGFRLFIELLGVDVLFVGLNLGVGV